MQGGEINAGPTGGTTTIFLGGRVSTTTIKPTPHRPGGGIAERGSVSVGEAVRVSWNFDFVIMFLYDGAALPGLNLVEGIRFRK